MTQNPDGNNPEDNPEGAASEGGRKLDEDAAWRSIIEHYGDRADISDLPPEEPSPPVEPVETPRFTVFERRWEPEPLNTEATWDNEGHFVPPVPPPIPKLEPRRKLAWIGLFGAPLLMLVAVVFGWSYPSWVGFLLIAGFLGGFGYLVATMPQTRGEDGSGDNGAVV